MAEELKKTGRKKGKKQKRKGKIVNGERVFHSRKHPRVPLLMEVEYTKGRKLNKGLSHDISHGGVFISSSDPLPGGKTTTIRFVLDPEKEPLKIKGRVAWVLEREKESISHHPTGMGVEFLFDDDKKRVVMGEFVRDLLDLIRIMAITESKRKDV